MTESLVTRYKNAYLIAKIENVLGQLTITASIGLGIILLVLSYIVHQHELTVPPDNRFVAIRDAVLFWGLLAAGPLVFAAGTICGVIMCAQAQVLIATVDTAVSTNPFLSAESRSKLMRNR